MPLWVRYTLFLTVLTVLLTALNLYVHRRAVRTFSLGKRASRVLGGVLIAGASVMVLARVLHRMGIEDGMEWMSVVGSVVQLGVMISAGLMMPVDGVMLGGRLMARLRSRFRPRADTAPTEDSDVAESQATTDDGSRDDSDDGGDESRSPLGRREFVSRTAWGSAMIFGGGSSVYGSAFGRKDYAIEQSVVALEKFPRTLDGYTIVQLSDIHFGAFATEREIRVAEDLVRSARPDAVVITGDIIDNDPRFSHFAGRLAERLSPLARDGVIAIVGNHDYYAGMEGVRDSLLRGGARVLINDGVTLGDRGGSFSMLGVDDMWAPRNGGQGPDLERALAMARPESAKVLLCHNPAFFPEAAGKIDLQLSGHTHGGQVNLLGTPELVLPFGYVKGHYEREGSRLYVNRGFGTAGPPARIGSPPEVSKIILTSA